MSVRIKATSVMGWPTWVVSVSEPINVDGSMERAVRFTNVESRGSAFSREQAETVLPFVLKVRPDAEIVEI